MIDITSLYFGRESEGNSLRYGVGEPEYSAAGGPRRPRSAAERKPVVVWNLTRTCNLRCIHCYSSSQAKHYPGELTTPEAKALIDDLAGFGVPALLLSGGEPLTRHDFWELVPYARSKGLKLTLSTNGTLIDTDTARRLKEHGFSYVGISLDGIGEINDFFRGRQGAFEQAAAGFRNCIEAGQKVGLRLTLTRHNVQQLDQIFGFIRQEGIQRVCFYHLVYSGRGADMRQHDLTHEETRRAIEQIIARTGELLKDGHNIEVLTVDNHTDGAYVLNRLSKDYPERYAKAQERLLWNGGGRFSSGVGIGDIDFLGNVHADQFWMDHSFGNVKERRFSEIWKDLSDPLLAGLRDQSGRIQGKCSLCKFYPVCGGGLRVRANRVYGTPWAPDPGCYFSTEECGISDEEISRLKSTGNWYDPPAHLEGRRI